MTDFFSTKLPPLPEPPRGFVPGVVSLVWRLRKALAETAGENPSRAARNAAMDADYWLACESWNERRNAAAGK